LAIFALVPLDSGALATVAAGDGGADTLASLGGAGTVRRVAVVADRAGMSQVLAVTLFALGADAGCAAAAASGVEAVWIEADESVVVTPALDGRVRFSATQGGTGTRVCAARPE